MANPGMFKTFDAEGDISPYRICAHGTKDYAVKQATKATDALAGTTDELGRQPNGRLDVCMGGQPEVEAGGALAAGAPLTSDTEGKAVKATEGGSRIIGFAMTGAAAGDIITYIYAPGTLGVAASAPSGSEG